MLRKTIHICLAPILALFVYSWAIDPFVYELAQRVGMTYLVVAMGTSLAALLLPFVGRAPNTPRQLSPVALTVTIAMLTPVIGSLLPKVITGQYLIPPAVAAISWALPPLGFVWAMLRYRLMGANLGSWSVLQTVLGTSIDAIFVVLGGKEILLEARILAVADVVEAMGSHRPYLPALGIQKALKEIADASGTLFHPEVVDACTRMFTERGFLNPDRGGWDTSIL